MSQNPLKAIRKRFSLDGVSFEFTIFGTTTTFEFDDEDLVISSQSADETENS